MTTRIAINGFGRIGRNILKCILRDPECADLEIVAINDLTSSKTLAHLFKYDSIQGRTQEQIDHDDEGLVINGKKIKILSVRNPAELP